MIRKSSLREAPLAHCTEKRPISLLIFSGAIVLTAQTIEIVPRIQREEKCVMCQHKFQFAWRWLQVTDQRGRHICTTVDFGSCFCFLLHSCTKTVSSPFQKHSELSVQIGNLSRLSGNKQWLADNGSLGLLSSFCSYIRTTGRPTVCHRVVGVAIWSVKNV